MPQDPLARQTDVAVASPPSEADYALFCDMMTATARGRWFLAEYLRRHRKTDTDAVLAALKRIERMLQQSGDGDAAVPAEPARTLLTVVPSSPAPSEPAPAAPANSNDGGTAAPTRGEPRIVPPVIDFVAAVPTAAPAAIPAPEPSFCLDTDPDRLYVPFEFEPLPAAAQVLPDDLPAAPPRKPATELFADVMALSPIERIALFS